MANDLTYLQQLFIRREAKNFQPDEIAETLGLTVDAVAGFVMANCPPAVKAAVVKKTRVISQKKKAEAREKKVAVTTKKAEVQRQKDAERLAILNARETGRKARMRREPKFKTIEVDLSQQIAVRINAKTTVFVKPGTDIAKIRKQYSKVKE